MAHVEKYTRVAVGHMLEHYARESNASNENIDPTRTPSNYNLAPQRDKTDFEYVRSRLEQVKVQNRKDVNVLADWCVTLPKDLPKNEEQAFFKAAYEFLEGKYGKENVVSAWVHRDEITPHLHFAFIPVIQTINKRTGEPLEKVSAKELLTRSELQNFHPALQKHMEQALGHSVSILNDATREGNEAVKDLKRKSAVEMVSEARDRASEIINEAKATLAPLKVEYEAYKAYIKASKEFKYEPPIYNRKKTRGVFRKEEYFEVTPEEWSAHSITYREKEIAERAQLALDNALKANASIDYIRDFNNLQYAYQLLERELEAKDRELLQLENALKKAQYEKRQFFEKLPAEQRTQLEELWNAKERDRGHHRFR